MRSRRRSRRMTICWWFAEMIDLHAEHPVAAVYDAMRAVVRPENGWKGGIGLAPHAPFTASARLYRDCAEIAREHDLPLTTHLAESREEMDMFRDGRGALAEFLRSLGRD